MRQQADPCSRPIGCSSYSRSLAEIRDGMCRTLTWGSSASQTRIMAHIYIRFDFGTDEEKAQQARHKLDGWKQAFRLDKRLLYKLDRPESATEEASTNPEASEKPTPAAKSKGKTAAKSAAKTKAKAS